MYVVLYITLLCYLSVFGGCNGFCKVTCVIWSQLDLGQAIADACNMSDG